MNEESIFAAAIAKKTPQERQAYLDESCRGNPALRAQVEELLSASAAAGSFFEHPPAGLDVTVDAADHDTHKSANWDGSLTFLQPTDTPGRIGKLIGNAGEYEIIEVVGSGGMGIVLRAFDTKLSRVVAVKVLAPELARNPTAVRRFLREAKAAAAVVHDHVVTIHNVEETHQPPFLVMQFIDGQTLQQKIDRTGTLGIKEILRIGCQAAAGLAAAHKHGLVHRDVKPANILLENGVERVKITDFGLARAADDVEITQQGMIAGTPQYMSPEQARGEPLDACSDLFSLGSVLYTMCAGRPAFRAETTVGVLRRVCDDAPRPIHEVNPELPRWLESVVSKLLSKNPDDRFQTADEVSELLSQCLAHVQNPAHAPLPPVVLSAAPRLTPLPPVRQPAGKPAATVRTPSLLLPLCLIFMPLLLVPIACFGLRLTGGTGARLFLLLFLALGGAVILASMLIGLILLITRLTAPRRAAASARHNGSSSQQSVGSVLALIVAFFLGLPILLAGALVFAWWAMPLRSPDDPYLPRRGDQVGEMIRDKSGRVTLPAADAVLPDLTGGDLTPLFSEGGAPLFNGRNLSGWKKVPDQPGGWVVEDGILIGRGKPGSAKRSGDPAPDLYTDRGDFQDFHFRAEMMLSDKADGAIYFRAKSASEPDDPVGYQVQFGNGKLGCIAGLSTDYKELRPGEWFTLQITAQGKHLTIKVNGETTAEVDDDAHQCGHFVLQALDPEATVKFRKIEVHELAAASATTSDSAAQPSAAIWGPVRDGWQLGIGWKNGKLRYGVGEQVEFELKVRNATDAEKTIRIVKPSDWDLWYPGGNELSARIFGRDEQDVKLAPREEKTIDVPNPRIDLAGLAGGQYRVKVTTDLGDKKQQPADDRFGFQYDGPVKAPLATGADGPLKHPNANFAAVSWGKPVLGLSLGIRLSSGGDPGEKPSAAPALKFFLWNVGDSAADVEYLEHHALDWPLFPRGKDGREYGSDPILTGPKMQAKRRLSAGEVLPLGSTTFQRNWLADRTPHGSLAAGAYQVWTKFNCRRLDYGQLNLQLTSGEATVEVKP